MHAAHAYHMPWSSFSIHHSIPVHINWTKFEISKKIRHRVEHIARQDGQTESRTYSSYTFCQHATSHFPLSKYPGRLQPTPRHATFRHLMKDHSMPNGARRNDQNKTNADTENLPLSSNTIHFFSMRATKQRKTWNRRYLDTHMTIARIQIVELGVSIHSSDAHIHIRITRSQRLACHAHNRRYAPNNGPFKNSCKNRALKETHFFSGMEIIFATYMESQEFDRSNSNEKKKLLVEWHRRGRRRRRRRRRGKGEPQSRYCVIFLYVVISYMAI